MCTGTPVHCEQTGAPPSRRPPLHPALGTVRGTPKTLSLQWAQLHLFDFSRCSKRHLAGAPRRTPLARRRLV